MAPQPFHSLGGSRRTMGIGISSVVDTHPDLAALVGQLIGLYSAVEVELTKFVTSCLGTDYIMAAEILTALERSQRARRQVVESIARSKFADRDDDWELIKKVLKRADTASKIRNPLAHHFWATTNMRDDILILIPPSAAATAHSHWKDLEAKQPAPRQPPFGRRIHTAEGELADKLMSTTDEAMYYTKAELQGHIETFTQTARYLQWAEQMTSPDPMVKDPRGRLAAALS